MNNMNIDKIINEEVRKILNEDFMGEGIGSLIKDYLHKHKNGKKKKKKLKLRKKRGGGKEYYDYDEYERDNKKVAAGDASTIRRTIDTDKTNIASVARDLFPDHTEEGAQSQLRKIINGERPMTNKIARKIEKMISAGEIAVK